jgi:hypothetical protein
VFFFNPKKFLFDASKKEFKDPDTPDTRHNGLARPTDVLPASFKRSRRALVLASSACFKVRAHAARKLQLHRFPLCSLTSHGHWPARRGVVLTSSPSIKHQADHRGSAGDVASAVQPKAVEYIAPSSPPGAIAASKSCSPPDPSQLEQYTSAPRSQVLAPLPRGDGTPRVPAIRGAGKRGGAGPARGVRERRAFRY